LSLGKFRALSESRDTPGWHFDEMATTRPDGSANAAPLLRSNPKLRSRKYRETLATVAPVNLDGFGMRNGESFRRRRADDLGLYST